MGILARGSGSGNEVLPRGSAEGGVPIDCSIEGGGYKSGSGEAGRIWMSWRVRRARRRCRVKGGER